jgi:tetratricopeptide (TPR) repeat protein
MIFERTRREITNSTFHMTDSVVIDLLKQGNAKYVDELFEESLALYSQALILDEKCVDAYVKRSACYLKLGQKENALADAEKATSLDANHDIAFLRKGMALFELGQISKAKEAFHVGAGINGNNAPQFGTWIKKCEVALASSSASTASRTTPTSTPPTSSSANASTAPATATNGTNDVTSTAPPANKPRIRCARLLLRSDDDRCL